jgi:hypothetical protein
MAAPLAGGLILHPSTENLGYSGASIRPFGCMPQLRKWLGADPQGQSRLSGEPYALALFEPIPSRTSIATSASMAIWTSTPRLKDDFRVIELTRPGSECSLIFGKNVTTTTRGLNAGNADSVASTIAIRRRSQAFEPFDPDPPRGQYS